MCIDVKRWIRMCKKAAARVRKQQSSVRKPCNYMWLHCNCCFQVLHSVYCLQSGMKWNHRCHRCMPPHFEHERHSFGSITFPLAHCANTIAMFATLWETFQNDKGNHLSSQKERWFLDSWCESAMEMKRSRLINEEAETIRQIYINAEFCLSIGLHRDKLPNKFYLVADLCHVFDQFKRSPVCHSFLKTILQHPVRPMLSPMLRPLLPWSGIPWAPLGQSRQSKSNQRCQWKVNGKEWKHYGIQGLLVFARFTSLRRSSNDAISEFVLQSVTFDSITFILALCTLEHNIKCQ